MTSDKAVAPRDRPAAPLEASTRRHKTSPRVRRLNKIVKLFLRADTPDLCSLVTLTMLMTVMMMTHRKKKTIDTAQRKAGT